MELSDYLRDPIYTALIGAAVTAMYILFKARINNEPRPENSQMIKPGILVGILIYFIVSGGLGKGEKILTEPF